MPAWAGLYAWQKATAGLVPNEKHIMTSEHPGNWIKNTFFALHYDLHAQATDTRLGEELTADRLREQLEKIRPDFIQCDCKGHSGFTSYPTKVGYPSPGIVRDALRIHRDVTRELGIRLLVHYSGVWDDQAIEHHPEWGVFDFDGKRVQPLPGMGEIACLSGPYVTEYMIPQLLEIIDEYDIDGFWVDGDNWAVRDCYCARCRAGFTVATDVSDAPQTREDPSWHRWRAFQRDLFVQYVRQYTEAVHRRKPDCMVCSNWMYSMRQPGPVETPVDFLSGDFDSSFGCERAQMEGRYLDGHGMPWNLMAWAFCSPVEQEVPHHGQTKTAAGLCQEAAEVMSCGGGMLLYKQPQRTGWLNDWEHDIFAEVGAFCRDRQPFCQDSQSVPETAVLHADQHVWHHNTAPFCMGDGFHAAEGALHVLMENQYHVDVLDETRLLDRIHGYALVVLGEQNPISDKVVSALETYARGGGLVLLTGSHVADMHPELAGVKAVGAPRDEAWYVAVDREAAIMSGPWQPVSPVNCETYAYVMNEQQPGKDETDYPAVTIRRTGKGLVAGIHGTMMRSYYLTHQPRIRLFVRRLLEHLNVPRKVMACGPPSIEISLRKQGERFLVHLVNRAVNPALTPRLHLVETVPPSGPVCLKVRTDREPREVRLEPGGRKVDWSYASGWMEAEIDSVGIHDIVVIA